MYLPASFVDAVCAIFVDRSVSVTSAPGIAACVESVIRPVIELVVVAWPNKPTDSAKMARQSVATRNLILEILFLIPKPLTDSKFGRPLTLTPTRGHNPTATVINFIHVMLRFKQM